MRDEWARQEIKRRQQVCILKVNGKEDRRLSQNREECQWSSEEEIEWDSHMLRKKRTEKRYREQLEEKRNKNAYLKKKFSKTKSLVNLCWQLILNATETLDLNFSVQVQGHRYYVGRVFWERAKKRNLLFYCGMRHAYT